MRVRRFGSLIGMCGVVAGCSTTISGAADPADTLGPTSVTTTTPTPTLVPAAGIADNWGLCPDHAPFTYDFGHGVSHWTTGTITANEDTSRISTTAQRQEPPPHTCAHVMAAQANVVVETHACGDGDTLAAANAIADRILAKVPQ